MGRCSAQQDQCWHSVSPCPDDRVLPELNSDFLGVWQIQSQHQTTLFAGPLIGRVLPNAGQSLKAELMDVLQECLLVLNVRLSIGDLAVRVPGGDEGAAVHAVRTVKRSQLGAELADVQCKRCLCLDGVFRLQVSLDGACVDVGGVRKQKTLRSWRVDAVLLGYSRRNHICFRDPPCPGRQVGMGVDPNLDDAESLAPTVGARPRRFCCTSDFE